MDTFVVRAWVRADEGERDAELRGVVEHVATGQTSAFIGGEQLLAFIRTNRGLRTGRPAATPAEARAAPAGREEER